MFDVKSSKQNAKGFYIPANNVPHQIVNIKFNEYQQSSGTSTQGKLSTYINCLSKQFKLQWDKKLGFILDVYLKHKWSFFTNMKDGLMDFVITLLNKLKMKGKFQGYTL